ncbi:hypothetical protein EVAR_55244_1 [Eumeta japonica]|uniref:Uncharacterized protein n=1 Tax=Eumeta variegata TaxID=151549 RepID=A0A4C1Y5W0_EUMVA|nr:hypothetical protein EVAR_55244_1 [Eumeta japonica]
MVVYFRRVVDWERGVSCNPATRRSEPEEGVRPGALAARGARRPDVRTKPGVDMGRAGEPVRARLAEEGRTGPGGKPSSQKSPHRAVDVAAVSVTAVVSGPHAAQGQYAGAQGSSQSVMIVGGYVSAATNKH